MFSNPFKKDRRTINIETPPPPKKELIPLDEVTIKLKLFTMNDTEYVAKMIRFLIQEHVNETNAREEKELRIKFAKDAHLASIEREKREREEEQREKEFEEFKKTDAYQNLFRFHI